MSRKSTPSTYGNVAVTLHWLSAALILILLGTGFLAANTTDPEIKARILSLHAPLGIAVMVLTLIRIGWWRFADRKPEPIAGTGKWQAMVAGMVHLLFYFVILAMAASGIALFALSGAGPFIFTNAPGPLPDFNAFPPRIPHGLGARAMVLLLLVHAGAALYHHFFKRDGLLKRMWFRNSTPG